MPNEHQSREGGEIMPIAVIGMGFRGPGDATNVENLWNMMLEAREAWSLVPKQKWNHGAFYHPDANRNGTVGHSAIFHSETTKLINFYSQTSRVFILSQMTSLNSMPRSSV